MLGTGWTEAVALAAAFIISAVATPAGISGAVLLLPFQISVLGTPSPAVTPTNLLYNVVSTPGGLYRYRRQQQTGGRLALILITGTLPGVIAGSVIRVELVPGPRVFDLMVAALLLPLGIWLAATRNHDPDQSARPARRIPARAERIEVGELRPLTDDWMLLTVMAAGMGNRHESVRTGGWDGLPGRRWRWGWRQPTR